MREKTYYVEKPTDFDIKRIDEKRSMVIFRENIKNEKTPDGTNQFSADEYSVTVQHSVGLRERIERDKAVWLNKAKENSYNLAANKIRTERNRLLEESDKEMCLDRLGVVKPNGSSFGDWLSFLQQISSVMFGEMAKYRQDLRDITKQEGFPYDVKFPEKPKKN
jgi:hypothetical protein